MKRRIIKIDSDKCDACGICVTACHEGAIELVNGKAKLMREDFCDGLGDCLPSCPTGAISFEEREAERYNEKAVKEALAKKDKSLNSLSSDKHMEGICPGSKQILLKHSSTESHATRFTLDKESQLAQWPCQIKLVPKNAAFFDNAKLLLAADCTAYAYANMHEDFMRGKVTLIGCPKLDEGDYTEKLTEILKENDIKALTIIRMEVPCCSGLERAGVTALKNSGKFIPWQVVTISRDGKILDN